MCGIAIGGAVKPDLALTQNRSGAFDLADVAHAERLVGVNRRVTTGVLLTEDFADFADWTNIKSTFIASGGKAQTNTTSVCVAMPTTVANRRNVRIDVKLTLGGTSGSQYCAIPFRATRGTGASSDKFTGYALRITRAGTVAFYTVVNNTFTALLNGVTGTVATTTSERYIVILVEGFRFRVWVSTDDTEPDITAAPTLVVYDYDHTHTTGWVGIMALSSVAGGEKFDDLSVQEVVHLDATPPRTYSDRPSGVSIQTEAAITACDLILPDGSVRALTTPGDVIGETDASRIFPRDWVDLDVLETGGYLLDVQTASSRSVLPLEVREKPQATFAGIGDTHITTAANQYYPRLKVVVDEINNERWWPKPTFVMHTGDVIDGGSADRETPMNLAKATLEELTVPYYAIAGNHDTAHGRPWEDDGAVFASVFGSTEGYTARGGFVFVWWSYTASAVGYYNSDDAIPLALVAAARAAYPTYPMICFSHAPFQDVIARTAGTSAGLYEDTAESDDMLAWMEADGNCIAHFTGHTHIVSRAYQNGVHHIGQGSPANLMDWVYVECYDDRVVVHRVPSDIWRCDYPEQIQGTSTDTLHTTTEVYNHGLPLERNVTLRLSDASVDITPAATHLPYQVGDGTLTANVTLGLEDSVGYTWGGLTFRRQDAWNYYAALLCLDTEEVVLQMVEDGEVTELARETVTGGLTVDVASELVVTLSGTGIVVTVDSTEEINTTDSTFTSGAYGVKASSGEVTVGTIAVS